MIETHPVYARKMVTENLAGLDIPGVEPIMGLRQTDELEEVEAQVVRRTDNGEILGVVGPTWKPVQNGQAFQFFDPMITDGLASYETAGSLRGGKLVWILARIGETKEIVPGDPVNGFLLLNMGHDGTRSVQVMPTTVRVVCANTNRMAEMRGRANNSIFKIKHTASAEQRLQDLGQAVRPYLESYGQTVEIFQKLAQRPMNELIVDQFLKTLWPDPKPKADGTMPNATKARNHRERVLALFTGQARGADFMTDEHRTSAWHLLQAVTEYIDHDRGSDDDKRMTSAWFGQGAKIKQQAQELLLV